MIEESNCTREPVGYVDEYGNFERVAQDWMDEEPSVTWRPVWFAAAQAAALPKGVMCSKCGVGRLKAPCPYGHTAAITGQCPMVVTAS